MATLLVSACGSAPVNHAQQVQAALDDARQSAIQQAQPRPLMVLTATTAHLFRADAPDAVVPIGAPLAKVLETIALTPRLAWWRLSQSALPTSKQAAQVAADARTVDALRQHLGSIPSPHRDRAEALLDQTRHFLGSQARQGSIDRQQLGAFVQRHRALSDQLLQDAAKLRIAALHKALGPWVSRLLPAEKATLRAVVIDAPDAREGHPTVQYLMGLLNAPGEGERIMFQAGGTVAQAKQTAARRAIATELGIEGYQDPRHLWQSPLAPGARTELEERPPY
jgi:hypothetical protein